MGALNLLSSSLFLSAGTGPRPFLGGLDSLLVLGELEPLHSRLLLRGEVTHPQTVTRRNAVRPRGHSWWWLCSACSRPCSPCGPCWGTEAWLLLFHGCHGEKIHPFKVQSSLLFDRLTKLYKRHHCAILEHLITPRKEPPCPLTATPHSLLPLPGSH